MENLEFDMNEIRTPTDGRTYERKWLKGRTKEVTQCVPESEFGFFLHLRFMENL